MRRMFETMRGSRTGIALIAATLCLSGCNDSAPDPRTQIGATPDLPDQHRYLVPPMHIAAVVGWGANGDGQLGNNSTTNGKIPVAVTTTGTPLAGKTITSIAAAQSVRVFSRRTKAYATTMP